LAIADRKKQVTCWPSLDGEREDDDKFAATIILHDVI